MAGRIRTIKPEILTDSKAARLSHEAWRLWVSTWVMADDLGRLPGSPDLLRASVFWGCDGDPTRALDELHAAGLVTRYQVHGDPYLAINGWTKHQRINRPSGGRCPSPDEGEVEPAHPDSGRQMKLGRQGPAIASFNEGSLNPHGGLSEDSLRDPDHDHDRERDRDVDRDVDLRPAARPLSGWNALSKTKQKVLRKYLSRAEHLWGLQEQLRREARPGARGLEPTAERLAAVAERLDAGATEQECELVLRQYADEAKRSDGRWFNGETNWKASNFTRTLGQVGSGGAGGANGAGKGGKSGEQRASDMLDALAKGSK